MTHRSPAVLAVVRCNTLRLAVAGLGVGVLLWSGSGCSKLRNQFPDRRFAREYVPPATRPVVMAPAVSQDDFTSESLINLPGAVQNSFVREHPDARITAVEQVPSGVGPMLYQISYLEKGMPGVTTYEATGTDMQPASAVVIRPNDSGRRPARYTPAQGGQPAEGTAAGAID